MQNTRMLCDEVEVVNGHVIRMTQHHGEAFGRLWDTFKITVNREAFDTPHVVYLQEISNFKGEAKKHHAEVKDTLDNSWLNFGSVIATLSTVMR